MNQIQKEKQLKILGSVFEKSKSVILMEIDNFKTSEIVELRKKLYSKGVGFKVVKNKVAQIALKYSSLQSLKEKFSQSTAIIWSINDAIDSSKVLMQYQEFKQLKLKIGYNSGKLITVDQIKEFSKLPGRDQARINMLLLIQRPLISLFFQIYAPARHVLGVIHAKAENN